MYLSFFRSSGVNHKLIFELEARSQFSEQHLMEIAGLLGVVWNLSVLFFLYSEYLSIPAYAWPLILIGLMVAFLINPTKTFKRDARYWLLRVLGKVVLAPFFRVEFAHFWLADQLNSLSTALADIQYMICFYISDDALSGG